MQINKFLCDHCGEAIDRDKATCVARLYSNQIVTAQVEGVKLYDWPIHFCGPDCAAGYVATQLKGKHDHNQN